jgi:hypothetical protein
MLKRQQSNGTVINNPMGYLQKLMQQEVLFYPQVIEPKKVVIDVMEQNLRLQSIKYHEKSLEDLRINYYEQQNEIIKAYFEENPIVKEELLESLKFGYDYNRQLSVSENLQRDSFKALLNAKVREHYPYLFKELDETFKRQEITIKQALRSLGWAG